MTSKLILCFMLISAFSCTSRKVRTEVREEMAKEPVAKNNTELYTTEQKALGQTEHLSPEQKNQLSLLIKKSREETQSIDNEILKTKAVLFKTLLSEKSSKAKINLLEGQLLKLNRKKTRKTLNYYREARDIVGKNERSLDRTLNMIDNKTIREF